jgi:hypothetical protein
LAFAAAETNKGRRRGADGAVGRRDVVLEAAAGEAPCAGALCVGSGMRLPLTPARPK